MNTFPAFILYALADMRITNGELQARPEFDPATHALILASEHTAGDEYRTIEAVYRTPDPVQVPGEPVLISAAIVIDGKEVQPARYETPLVWHQPDPVLVSPERREQIASGAVKEYERRKAEWAAQQPAPAPAPEPVPQSVTRRQLLLALNRATPRITFAQIEAILPTLGLPEQALEDAYIELENGSTFDRSHSLVTVIKAALSVDDAWCDERWREAAKL